MRTPHNVGFAVADELVERLGGSFRRRFRFRAKLATVRAAGRDVILVKPQTYMNLSGSAVSAVARFRRVDPADVIAVVDDADLALGRLRIRPRGSSGGHRGLRSIEEAFGCAAFPRIRIGIGRSGVGEELVGYVLRQLPVEAWKREFEPAVDRACDALLCMLEDGVETAMNRFNGPVKDTE